MLNDAEESDLENYLNTESHVYYGLSPRDVRKFAFEYALALKKKITEGCKDKEISGPECFANFCIGMRPIRWQQVSVELPVSTRLTLILFSDNLKAVLDRLRVGPGEIWNMDETGTTIMQTRDRVVANR